MAKRRKRVAKRRIRRKREHARAATPPKQVAPLSDTKQYESVQGSTWVLVGFTVVLFAIALVVALLSPTLEQIAPDTDGDGIIDVRDLCPDTGRGALVDHRGCSFEQIQQREAIGMDQFEKRFQTP